MLRLFHGNLREHGGVPSPHDRRRLACQTSSHRLAPAPFDDETFDHVGDVDCGERTGDRERGRPERTARVTAGEVEGELRVPDLVGHRLRRARDQIARRSQGEQLEREPGERRDRCVLELRGAQPERGKLLAVRRIQIVDGVPGAPVRPLGHRRDARHTVHEERPAAPLFRRAEQAFIVRVVVTDAIAADALVGSGRAGELELRLAHERLERDAMVAFAAVGAGPACRVHASAGPFVGRDRKFLGATVVAERERAAITDAPARAVSVRGARTAVMRSTVDTRGRLLAANVGVVARVEPVLGARSVGAVLDLDVAARRCERREHRPANQRHARERSCKGTKGSPAQRYHAARPGP